jgi:hypothetical protein
VFYLTLGYFISYLPYVLLAKALFGSIVPGVDRPVGGLVMLSAAALGQLLAMPIFVGVSGWWRFASEQRVGRRRMLWPGRDTAVAAMVMEVHTADSPMTDAACAVLQDAGVMPSRLIAALIQQGVQKRLAERFL